MSSLRHVIYVLYVMYCNVGWCVKGSAVHHRHQQCLVAEWLGLSVTVRVRARAREWDFFFLFMLKVTDTFVLHVRGSCGVQCLRTTTVHDITMMYCKEWYMENVPKDNCYWSHHSHEKYFHGHGIPELIILNNGPQYLSEEFPKFMRE